jgi:thymidylate kinase
LISAIAPVLERATNGALYVKHLRPGLLPPLSRLKLRHNEPMGSATDPHGSKPSGIIGSLLRMVYLNADYFFGYWLVVRPKIARRPAVVLFDRYAYDMAIDPQRFRISLSGKLVSLITCLAPKPDIIICLHGPPEVVNARKKELPVEEIARQVSDLKEFAKNESRAVLISTDASLQEVSDRALCAVRDFCTSRGGRNLSDA